MAQNYEADQVLDIPEPGPEVLSVRDADGDIVRRRSPSEMESSMPEARWLRNGNEVTWREVCMFPPLTVREVVPVAVITEAMARAAHTAYSNTDTPSYAGDMAHAILAALTALGIPAEIDPTWESGHVV